MGCRLCRPKRVKRSSTHWERAGVSLEVWISWEAEILRLTRLPTGDAIPLPVEGLYISTDVVAASWVGSRSTNNGMHPTPGLVAELRLRNPSFTIFAVNNDRGEPIGLRVVAESDKRE